MGRITTLRNRVAELIDTSDDPEPRGYSGDDQPTGTIIGNYLENNPPDEELQKYWQIYRDVGLIQGAIDNFASEVLEPGWYVTADSEETVDELTEYMENVAVTNLEVDQNFSELARKMIVEREVRGTVFVEKVTDDQDRHRALYPLQNDTITIYTKAGKAMLPAPDDDTDVKVLDSQVPDGGEYRVPQTETGETGAFVQFDDIKPRWSAKEEVVYTRDDIVHWPRDADIGKARGVSRIRAIQDRAEGWLQKVQDNDAAIRSKAWPMIIFNLGTEENPWSREQANDFLEHYDEEQLEPGMMQAVSGDVDVDEFAGETADIEAALQHDINAIMSGMPGPVYATGGFSQNVAPAVARAQERQFIKEVKATRRDLENKITPYLREVAEDYDLDASDSVEFHIGRPAGEVAPEDVSGSIIRYTSDADPSNQGARSASGAGGSSAGSGQGATNEGGQSGVGSPQPGQATESGVANRSNSVSQNGFSMQEELADPAPQEELADPAPREELADPRFVRTEEYKNEISGRVSSFLQTARDNVIDEFDRTYSDAPVAGAGEIDGIARRAMESTMNDSNVQLNIRPTMENVVEDTVDTMNQDNHDPSLSITYGIRHRRRAREMAENVRSQARQIAEEMLNDISTQVERSAQRGDPSDEIIDRIESSFDDSEIESRSDLVGHMECQNAVNTTKLIEYDQHPDVDGIRVINTCGSNTVSLCEQLAGCGSHDEAVAWFDSEESISDQLESFVSDDSLFDDFTPVPSSPPFHYGCSSEIVPARRNNDD